MCLIGYTINISNVGTRAKYLGIFFCVTGSYSSLTGVVSWCVTFLIRRLYLFFPSGPLTLHPIISFSMKGTILRIWHMDHLRLGNNLSGQYKRGAGMALQIGIGNFSAAIAANIYRAQDRPRFILGRESTSYILLGNQDELTLVCAQRRHRTYVCWHGFHLCTNCRVHLHPYQWETGRGRTAGLGEGRFEQVFRPGASRIGRSGTGLQVYHLSGPGQDSVAAKSWTTWLMNETPLAWHNL